MIPPRSILAAIDFSAPSRVALACAARLANTCHASLHVLHAEDPQLTAAAGALDQALSHEIREELAAFVASALPGATLAPTPHVVVGAAVRVICDIANREQVDLVVMGRRGLASASHGMVGSTAEGVLVHSNVSVLIVPEAWTAPDPDGTNLAGAGPLIAAIECTTPALAATGAACRLAKVLAARVHAIHVVPTLSVLGRWSSQADSAHTRGIDKARRDIDPLVTGLQGDVPLQFDVDSGAVADRLAAAAARLGPHSILVMGRHSLGSTRGAPGDIARRLLAQTQSLVLVFLPDE
jgi:nucleotide-binding universal stress UspA family protein